MSQLLYDSLAISAWKKAGLSTWALRCNPSSGNLHPTEAYLLVGPIAGLIRKPALLHYASSNHAIEVLRYLESEYFANFCQQLPKDAFLLGLSSIVWREAWKYGERAFRYCNHDVGHAIQALACAARILGWRVRRVEGMTGNQLDRLLGLEASSGAEAEHSDVLLVIETLPSNEEGPVSLKISDSLLTNLCSPLLGQPNTLSLDHKIWPVLPEVERATRDNGLPHGEIELERARTLNLVSESQVSARMIVRQRRSAVAFDGNSGMAREQFYQMMVSATKEAF